MMMKGTQFIKVSVILGMFFFGVFIGIMLSNNDEAAANKGLTLIATQSLLGETWSDEQKEVWETEEQLWDSIVKEDIENSLSCYHSNFRGWWYKDPLPRGKDSEVKWAPYDCMLNEKLVFDLTPVAINVHDNFACVHYYYKLAFKDAEGKHKMELGRWTDILIKENGKWLLICDHGGPTSVE